MHRYSVKVTPVFCCVHAELLYRKCVANAELTLSITSPFMVQDVVVDSVKLHPDVEGYCRGADASSRYSSQS